VSSSSSSTSTCKRPPISLTARMRAAVLPTAALVGKTSWIFQMQESKTEGDYQDEFKENYAASGSILRASELPADGREDPCLKHVVAATLAEAEAVSLDRAKSFSEALGKYSECEQELSVAVAMAATLDNHVEDHSKLIQHRSDVLTRMTHLQAALLGESAPGRVEENIQPVELTTFQVFTLDDHDPDETCTDRRPLEAFALPLNESPQTRLPRSLRESAEGMRAAVECAALGAGNLTVTVAGSLAGGFVVLGGAAAASTSTNAREGAGARPDAALVVNEAAQQAGRFAAKMADSASGVTGTLAAETQRLATRISKTEVTDAITTETQRMVSRLADAGSTAVEGSVGVTSSIRRTVKGASSTETQTRILGTAKQVTNVVSTAFTEAPGQLSRLTQSLTKAPRRSAQQPGSESMAPVPWIRSYSCTAVCAMEVSCRERPEAGSARRRSFTHPPCKHAKPFHAIEGL